MSEGHTMSEATQETIQGPAQGPAQEPTITLQKLLYVKIVTDGMNAEEATDDIMNDWGNEFSPVENQLLVGQLFGLMRPLVSDRAKRIYRAHTRALEDRVFSAQPIVMRKVDPITGAVTSSTDDINWHEAQKHLVERSFNLPDGRWVKYADSTPEDHEQRARWQSGRANSIHKDAQRHERLAQLMREHDVERLGDLDVDLWKGIVASAS